MNKYDLDTKLKDAWLHGKIESAFLINRQLNGFKIDTEVKEQCAYLSGTVKSSVDKQLAQDLTLKIDGVESVINHLEIKNDFINPNHDSASFSQWFDDSTTTAAVKSTLLLNQDISGLKISVETSNGVVTLQGNVNNEVEKLTAQKIAYEFNGVQKVENHLKIN